MRSRFASRLAPDSAMWKRVDARGILCVIHARLVPSLPGCPPGVHWKTGRWSPTWGGSKMTTKPTPAKRAAMASDNETQRIDDSAADQPVGEATAAATPGGE